MSSNGNVKTTLGALVDADMTGALNRLSALRLSAKQAYHAHRLIGFARAELKEYDARRMDLVKQYGAERPSTDAERRQGAPRTVSEVDVNSDGWDAFSAEVKELKAVEVELPWRPFNLCELGTNEIMPADVTLLGALVCWDEPQDQKKD
jgi:hypothetical protein